MTTRILTPFLATMVFLAMMFQTLAAMAETAVIDGTVSYGDRIALPPDASLEVKLVDISLADAPSKTLAETKITPAGQVPIPYRLEYLSSDIQPGHSYALQARITVGDQLWFITATRHPILTGDTDGTDIVMERVTDAAAPVSPVGNWLAEDIRGGGVIDRLQTVLEIAEDGRVSGTGGCNRIIGMATISDEGVEFGPIAATQMACMPAAMEQEAKFLAALREVRAWRIDPERNKLTLLDEDGQTLIVLTRL